MVDWEKLQPSQPKPLLNVIGLGFGFCTLRASSGGAEVSARTVIVR